MPDSTFLAERSLYIENTLRHAFVYDLCRHLLLLDPPRMVTVLNAEVDDSGVDLILTVGGVTRPVQMKTVSRSDKPTPYNISERLFALRGGCVIWTLYDPVTMVINGYHFFGNGPLEPMGNPEVFKQSTKGSKDRKKDRPGYRKVRIGHAQGRNLTISALAEILFGDELRSGE